MNGSEKGSPSDDMRIVIVQDGQYRVLGNIPLVSKTQVVSEFGEPLTWKKERTIEASGEYSLCRCGESQNKPFCDSTHCEIDFDGSERANTSATAGRKTTYHGSPRIVVKKDPNLCMESGFCGTRDASFAELVARSDDTQIRSLVIAMVERCPSGALTYHFAADEQDIEPDYPRQVADTTEITSDGPIAGPLWVTGYIPIQRADGKPFEPRNRVTLCNCGQSGIKPLCDGTHRQVAQRQARARRMNAR
jgi:CDGSH-type Zn-finger protein